MTEVTRRNRNYPCCSKEIPDIIFSPYLQSLGLFTIVSDLGCSCEVPQKKTNDLWHEDQVYPALHTFVILR